MHIYLRTYVEPRIIACEEVRVCGSGSDLHMPGARCGQPVRTYLAATAASAARKVSCSAGLDASLRSSEG